MKRFYVALAMCFTLIACAMTSVRGAEYIVNPSLSKLTVDGTASLGITMSPQSTGTDILTFQGSVFANVGVDSIEFLDDTDMDAIVQGTNLAPAIGGGTAMTPGSDPADAGLQVRSVFNTLLGYAALRSIATTLSSGSVDLDGGEFATDGVTVGLTEGTLDYNVNLITSFIGTEDLSSEAGATEGLFGTVVVDGDIETITLPVDFAFDIPVSEFITVNVTLEGEIVASRELGSFRQIPEPGTVALFSIGVVACLPIGLRRMKHRRNGK